MTTDITALPTTIETHGYTFNLYSSKWPLGASYEISAPVKCDRGYNWYVRVQQEGKTWKAEARIGRDSIPNWITKGGRTVCYKSAETALDAACQLLLQRLGEIHRAVEAEKQRARQLRLDGAKCPAGFVVGHLAVNHEGDALDLANDDEACLFRGQVHEAFRNLLGERLLKTLKRRADVDAVLWDLTRVATKPFVERAKKEKA